MVSAWAVWCPLGQGSSTPPAGKAMDDGPEARAVERGAKVEEDSLEAEWALLEKRLKSCLETFQASIGGFNVAPHQSEQVLDELVENGMANIQKSFKTREGNLLLYRHFRRLHRTLRSRIANMVMDSDSRQRPRQEGM